MLRLLDVNVRIIRTWEDEIIPDIPDGSYMLLKDCNGVLLKTSDGFYLAAKKG